MIYPNVKLVLKTTSTANESISTTLGYCNPNADDGMLTEFARKLNSFTDNTFVEITKVETTDVTTAEYYPYTLNVNPQEITFTDTTNAVTVTVTVPNDVPAETVSNAGLTVGNVGGYTKSTNQGTGTNTITFTLKANASSTEKRARVYLTLSGEQITPTYYIDLIPNIE